jgi:anti-sigma factor RsiW
MNHDPVYNRLRETHWRRELTDAEQAELRAFLTRHPEARADWETESGLNAGLKRLPDAPVSSNFTARVLQTIALEVAAAERARQPASSKAGWWRVFLPRAAVALVVVAAGWLGYDRYQLVQRVKIVEGLAVVAAVPKPPSAEALENFEAIRGLGSTPAGDEELLALNDDLLALMP